MPTDDIDTERQTGVDYRQQILNILHSESDSWAKMTRRLGVTKAYITKLTSQMLADGIIEEREVKENGAGRPQQRLAVSRGQAYSVNIMLRRGSLQGTLNDDNTQRPAVAILNASLPDTFLKTISI